MVRLDPVEHTPLTRHTGWPSIGRSTFTLLHWVPPKTWLTANPVRCSDLFLSKMKNGVPGKLYHFKSCNIKDLRQVLFRSWLFHLRHKGEEVTIRVHQRNVAYQKWLMRAALGASEKALGRLWPTLVTLKVSIEAEKKTSFTLSSCLMGSLKEKSSPPLRGLGR